jgi:predicted metal-dependent enzyme (double-stranded beta helix superfamily)
MIPSDVLSYITEWTSNHGDVASSRIGLERIGRELKKHCTDALDTSLFPSAQPGEELLYELAVDSQGGPSLYLVSDGVGVSTPPHEHQTWAVIIGIRGREFNVIYRPAPEFGQGRAAVVSECIIGPGDVFVMLPEEIHGIDHGRGNHPTYHIHLYGRPLSSLPRLESRLYIPHACPG